MRTWTRSPCRSRGGQRAAQGPHLGSDPCPSPEPLCPDSTASTGCLLEGCLPASSSSFIALCPARFLPACRPRELLWEVAPAPCAASTRPADPLPIWSPLTWLPLDHTWPALVRTWRSGTVPQGGHLPPQITQGWTTRPGKCCHPRVITDVTPLFGSICETVTRIRPSIPTALGDTRWQALPQRRPGGRRVAHGSHARPHLLSHAPRSGMGPSLCARQGGSMLSRSTDSPGCPLPGPHPPRQPSAWVICSLERARVELEVPFLSFESRSFLRRLRRSAWEFWAHLCIWVCERSKGSVTQMYF